MTIQRQYSLPNCTLVLEGLGHGLTGNETRPLMSILVNAQCRFLGSKEQILAGGREFFESLVRAVNAYAQGLLSGLQTTAHPAGPVQLHQLGPNQHRLSVTGPTTEQPDGQATASVELSTVQLFDLVEAIDQFLVDQQTLPDLALNMAPLSKRWVRTGQPLVKQSLPAAVGLSGLALATLAAFLPPQPKVEQPKDLFPENSVANVQATPAASPPSASATPSAATPSASVSASPLPSASASPDPEVAKLDKLLTQAPLITDAAELESAKQQLTSKIEQAWKTRTGLNENLTYRLGVAKDGTILGYKPEGDAALTQVKLTPLTDLVYTQTSNNEPLGQFRATFTKDGKLEIVPFKEQSQLPALGGGPNEITDAAQLATLQPKLYGQLMESWKQLPPASSPQTLSYRVRLKPDGTVVDYLPEAQVDAEHAGETPLPKLSKLADDTPPQESLALFKVVFRNDQALEVSPWRGRP